MNNSFSFKHLNSDPERRNIGLLCNPNSGRNKKQLAEIERIIATSPNIHYVPTVTEHDIPAALDIFARADIDVLAINGGDGTVAHVLTQLLREQRFAALPPFILLPGGTTNMNVGDVGIKGKIIPAVHRLVDWADGKLETRAVLTRPALEVCPGDGLQPLYGMLFGTGAIIQAIEYWNSTVKRSGFRNEFSSGLAMLRTVWGLVRGDPRFSKPVPAVITLDDGQQLELDIMLMAVSSMRRVFLNFTPFWGTEPQPLNFTVIRSGADRFLCAFLPVFRGRPNRLVTPESGYFSHNIKQLTIAMSGAFTLDGDIYHTDRSAGPVHIRHFCDMPFIRF